MRDEPDKPVDLGQVSLEVDSIILKEKQSESNFRAVLDALPAAVYTTDAAGRITYYNRAAADLAGREPKLGIDEWCVTWRMYLPDGAPLPHECCPMALTIKEGRAIRGVEAVLERPDGTRIPFLPYPTPLRDASGTLIGAVNMLVEISERQAAATARAYFASIIESSDDGIVSKDLNGIITSWNRGAEAIFGYTADEMIGRPISTIFPPDRLAEEDLILERIRQGEQLSHFETVRRCKDGRDIDVSLTISPVRDEIGRIVGISKITRDITEQKRAERMLHDLNENLEQRVVERTRELSQANRRLLAEIAERERAEAALRQAQKMEAVGQLAAGMAHDFNNLLTAILGNLELLEAQLADDNALSLIRAASRAVLRGARLNEQVLAFSRKQHLAPRTVDLNALIGAMSELLRRTLGGTVDVTTELASDLWPALADPTQIELVILNLAINARDALPGGGSVHIATRNVSAGNTGAESLPSGDYVCIAVSDNGIGMSESVLARACEPFFTTKEPGNGSGLGLPQVYGVARQSGGDIAIRSAVGQGTTVEVYLPRSTRRIALPDNRRKPVPETATPRAFTILVVDDQPDVREVAVAHLESLGYQVAQASNGATALGLIANGIDLLITDYAMAEMNGIELAQTARVRRPDLPVVIVTGSSKASAVKERIQDAVLLKKPYRLHELTTAVGQLLRTEPEVQRTGILALHRA